MRLGAVLCHVLGHRASEYVIVIDERLGRAYRTTQHLYQCPRCKAYVKEVPPR